VAKKQTEFTFEEARKAALDDLSVVIDFAGNLGDATTSQALVEWARTLERLRAKVRFAQRPSLTERDIRMVYDFAQNLITGMPMIALQLSRFWALHEAINAQLRGPPEGEKGYRPEERIAELARRIDGADRFASAVVREALQSTGVLALGAILMVHIARVDTIEYALMHQLGDAVRRFKLEGEFDPAEMCSVEGKVPRLVDGKSEWRTDVRAIRDAAAHFKFRFEIAQNDWTVEFKNDGHGYQFERKFTRKELIRFFDQHTLLYKSQLVLLKLWMLLHVLTTHFWDRQKPGTDRGSINQTI